MQEDDIDIMENSESAVSPLKRRLVMFAVFALVICAGLAALLLRGHEDGHAIAQAETPHQAYLKILGETHTGLRLVRLGDFVQNVAPNINTTHDASLKLAKTAHNALALNEQMAWAKLTDALYDLKNTEAEKAGAFIAYKDIWGVWSRQDDLPKLLEITQTQAVPGISAQLQYAPNNRKSKFRQNNSETTLAGAINTAPPPVRISSRPPITLQVQKARIKYAKRPRYPRRARRKGVEASITLSLDIDERGNVARTQVVSIQAEKYKDKFIRATRRAAMASKFHPKTINGNPVASSGYVRQYTFTTGE